MTKTAEADERFTYGRPLICDVMCCCVASPTQQVHLKKEKERNANRGAKSGKAVGGIDIQVRLGRLAELALSI